MGKGFNTGGKVGPEEGYSARPPLLASSIASSFLDKPELAAAIAQRGLETNPGHPLLINNAAFAIILQGKPQKALFLLLTLWAADSNAIRKTERICLLATTGLACFRLGNEKQGRRYYEMATEAAKDPENEPSANGGGVVSGQGGGPPRPEGSIQKFREGL